MYLFCLWKLNGININFDIEKIKYVFDFTISGMLGGANRNETGDMNK